jgi:hypothetical protein
MPFICENITGILTKTWRLYINQLKCLLCLMKDQVWSENSLGMTCFNTSYSFCHILGAFSYIFNSNKCNTLFLQRVDCHEN